METENIIPAEHKENHEQNKPISYRFENKTGVFKISEDKNGIVNFEIENADGSVINLNEFIPQGYGAIGNVRIWNDPTNYLGLAGTKTSFVDPYTKTIIISEKEIKVFGWKYILTLLHEIGHIVNDEKNPELRKKINETMSDSYKPISDEASFANIKEHEKLVIKDERRAWAFALRQLKDKKGLNADGRIFKNVAELISFITGSSLGIKADEFRYKIKNLKMPQFAISDEAKEKLKVDLIEEISRAYVKQPRIKT